MRRADRLRTLASERRGSLACLAALFAASFVLPDYLLFLGSTALVAAIFARSIGLATLQAGLLMLGALGFAGCGAWFAATGFQAGLPFVPSLLFGAAACVPLGALVGVPALRLRGIDFGIVTLAFSSAVVVVLGAVGFPGSLEGASIVRPDWAASEAAFFRVVLLMLVVSFVALDVVGAGGWGRGWLAVKTSERAAAAMGIDARLAKLQAISLAAGLAGLGGALAVAQVGLVTSGNFAEIGSLVIFAVAMLTRARTPGGALAAGLIGVTLPEVLRRTGLPHDLADLMLGLGAIAALTHGARRTRPSPGTVDGPRPTTPAAAAAVASRVTDRSGATPLRPPAPVATSPVALELDGLSVRYGCVDALVGVTFTLHRREVLGLVGPNGAGKSSLVDALSGFVVPCAGEVRLEGRTLHALPVHRRARLGLRRTFQQDRSIAELDVVAQIALAAGAEPSDDDLRWALELARLDRADAHRPIGSLPVATRRLLELAGQAMARPAALLLDEPAAGLPADESMALARRIAELPQRFGCGVLLIEHDMEVVRLACDRVAVLDFGRVIAAGEPLEVLARREVVAAYLGLDDEAPPAPEPRPREAVR